MSTALQISQNQAEEIAKIHLQPFKLSSFEELRNNGYSYTSSSQTYTLHLKQGNETTHSAFLTISFPPGSSSAAYNPNSLGVVAKLIDLIGSQTSIPLGKATLDTSLSIIPFEFLLTPPSPLILDHTISVSEAKRQGLLSEKQQILVNLKLGQFLGQLHTGVQNEWFGQPLLADPSDPSYSWQETFTRLLEGLLSELEGSVTIAFQEIRLYLSRAIGSFLFDDVEVPSLVWFTGSEEDIYLLTSDGDASDEPPTIAAIAPNVAHAIWGDPLMETFFMPSGPPATMLEGYIGGGGQPLVLFPRQKTKRLWYTLFLSLVVLKENDGKEGSKVAFDILQECVELLKNAPCY